MVRIIAASILMFSALAGCGGEDPTTPVGGVDLEGNHLKSAPAETPSSNPDEEKLDAFRNPGMNIHKFNNPRGGSMTRRTWKAAYRVDRAVREYARDNGVKVIWERF